MDIKTIKIVKIPELELLKEGTWRNLYDVFYYTRLFKYVHKKHYRMIKDVLFKNTTTKKLQELCDLGYLSSPQKDVYTATDKVLPILKEAGGYNGVNALPLEPKGKGEINELNNTEVFIKLQKEEHFYTLLYPNFIYLRPDALMVQLDPENRKYKLTFIEVEAKKPDWNNWIKRKHENYLRLSKDVIFYEEWKKYCKLLGLPEPTLDVKFNYKIINYE